MIRNTLLRYLIVGLVGVFWGLACWAQSPELSSWYTAESNRYARIYETWDDRLNDTSVTTWSRGDGDQAEPVYRGPQEITYSDQWVYVKTPNYGVYIMGPWYVDEADSRLFGNLPGNQAVTYRFPRNPVVATESELTRLSTIGFFVDGSAIFDTHDGFSYDTSAAEDEFVNTQGVTGDAVWNREAVYTEGVTTDVSSFHQAGSYFHAHSTPLALRHILGDSVDYDEVAKTYSENFNGQHSPIIGWIRDGFPLYGPYGYSDPTDPTSDVRRMITGYALRDGSLGTDNINVTGRTSLPQWSVDVGMATTTALAATYYGPDTDHITTGEDYELGKYNEDYAYKGHLGLSVYEGVASDGVFDPSRHFDLNEHNARFCITPEFPEGTWAYFTPVNDSGQAAYPYNVGRTYLGEVSGGTVTAIAEAVEVYFQGGPESEVSVASIRADPGTDVVTMIWNVIEGGSYALLQSDDLSSYSTVSSHTTANGPLQISNDTDGATRRFYALKQIGIADYDNSISFYDASSPGKYVSFIFSFGTQPPIPPEDVISEAAVGGVIAGIESYDQSGGSVTLSFDQSQLEPATNYSATLKFTPPTGTEMTLTSTSYYSFFE